LDLAVRFLVDPFAGADSDDSDLPVLLKPVNNPEPAHPVASQAGKLVAKRLSRVGIGKERLERRPELPLDVRMERAEDRSGMVGYTKPVGALFHGKA